MTYSNIWAVDQIAAANLSRYLAIDFSEEQMSGIAQHLAEHRSNSFSLIIARLRLRLRNRIQLIISDNKRHRGSEFTAGCITIQEEVHTAILYEMQDASQAQPLSKGQILRTMMRESKKDDAANFKISE